MEDFVMRSISEEGKNRMFSVHRMRTSKDAASIKVKTWNRGEICFEHREGDNPLLYEEYARELGEMLIRIANNPCKLPEVKE